MEKLNILWTSDNLHTAHNMLFMYAINSKLQGWWNEVDIIIWGGTAKLVAENESIQEKIKMAKQAGVEIKACAACARQFGVVEELEKQGIEVKPMGKPLTDIIKNNEKMITV